MGERESNAPAQQELERSDMRLAIDPYDTEALITRGKALRHLGQVEASVGSLAMAIAIGGSDGTGCLELGKSLLVLGGVEKHSEVLFVSRADRIHIESARRRRAHVHYSEALSLFNRALSAEPTLVEAMYMKACALSLLGEVEDALGALARAVECAESLRVRALGEDYLQNVRTSPTTRDRFYVLIGGS